MPSSIFRVKYGLDVGGDIIVSGTVDSVDLAAFKISYDNHNHNATYATIAQATGSVTQHNDVSNAGSGIIISVTERTKLGTIESGADVTDATNVAAAGALMKSSYNANTILYATSDNTPLALTVAASTIVGRTASGVIDALTAAEVRTIINVENGADITDSTNVNAAGAVMNSDFDAGTFLYASTDNNPITQTPSQVRGLLNIADGANNYTHPNHSAHVHSVADGSTTIQDNVIDADMLQGDAGALGDGTNGYALIAGSVVGKFAWHGFGAAADKGVVTSVDTSANLATSNAVKTYVDNQISGMGQIRPAVDDVAELKALTPNSDKDMVLVESLGLYRFDAQATDTGNDNTIITPTAGGGRWFKMSSTINEHSNLDGIDKWGGVAGNTYHVPNINSNSSTFLNGSGTWSTPPGTYTHPSHTGEVTGSGALTITNNSVTNAKLADMLTARIKGRVTTGTGDPEDLTAAQVRTMLNIADGANNYTHPSDGVDPGAALSGAYVFSDITVNTAGHVTGSATRQLTLANLGFTGAANANYYIHPSHTGDVTGSGVLTIANGKIKEQHLQAAGGGTLSGGGSGNVLQWATGGTFQWGTTADPSVVAFDYGDSNSFTRASVGTSSTVIDSFTKATSRSAEWLLSINDITNSRYETLKIYAVHDGTNVYYNEFGNVHTTLSPGVTFSVAVNGANIELSATGASANNTIKGILNLIDV